MINNIVNSQNFLDAIKSIQQCVQQINETLEKKAALPEELRKQQESFFDIARHTLAYTISVNNDTPLNQIAPLFSSHKQCAEILKPFNFAVRRNSKTKQLKRTDYAKLDVDSVVKKILEVPNPYSLTAIAEQKELKRLAKENVTSSEKVSNFKKRLLNLVKGAEKDGLSDIVKQLEAIADQCTLEEQKLRQEEANELAAMPSIASSTVKAA